MCQLCVLANAYDTSSVQGLSLEPGFRSLGETKRIVIPSDDAQGKWNALDPSLQRRVEGAGEVLEIATRGRKAWIEAVAAQQTLKYRRNMANNTEVAKELGQRMVAIGNWSKVQFAPIELTAANARMDLRRAQYTMDRAHSNLVKTLGLTGRIAKLSLPQELPAIPSQPMSEFELQQRADAIGAQLPMAERITSP